MYYKIKFNQLILAILILLASLFALSNCSSTNTCKITEFRCSNGQCISQNRYCNGIADCVDRSDEVRFCSPCNKTYSGDLDSSYSLNLHRFSKCEINFLTSSDQIIQLMGLSTHSTTIQIGEHSRYAFETPFKYYSKNNLVKVILDSYDDVELVYKFMRKEKSSRFITPYNTGGSLLPSTLCSFIYNNCQGCLITSPNYPGSFPINITCYYAIKASGLISLEIPDKFRNGSALTIYDGYTIMDRKLIKVENGTKLKHPVVGSGGEMLLEFWTGNGKGEPFEIKINLIKKDNFSCDERISSLKLKSGVLHSAKYTLPKNTSCKIEFKAQEGEILKLEIYKFFIENSDCAKSHLDIFDGDELKERLCSNSTYKSCDFKVKFGQSARDCNAEESYILHAKTSHISFELEDSTVSTNFQYKIGFEFIRGGECNSVFEPIEMKFLAPKNPYKAVCNYTFLRGGRLDISEFRGYPVKLYEYVLGTRFLRGTFARDVMYKTFERFELLTDRPVSFNGRFTPIEDRGNCLASMAQGPAGRISLNSCHNMYLISPKKSENYLYLTVSTCHGLKVFSPTEQVLCKPEIFSKNWYNESYTEDHFILQYNGPSTVNVDYVEISKNVADCKVCENFACIDPTLFCNGVENCPDGFDERDCDNGYFWFFVGVIACLFILILIVFAWRYTVRIDEFDED